MQELYGHILYPRAKSAMLGWSRLGKPYSDHSNVTPRPCIWQGAESITTPIEATHVYETGTAQPAQGYQDSVELIYQNRRSFSDASGEELVQYVNECIHQIFPSFLRRMLLDPSSAFVSFDSMKKSRGLHIRLFSPHNNRS